jgi:hypothetical protein
MGMNIAVLRKSAIEIEFIDIGRLTGASGDRFMTKKAIFGRAFASPSTEEQI